MKLEGLVTANANFKILEDGSIVAVNGKFEGEVKATSGSFGVMTFSGEIYDSSTGRISFGVPDTSYTVISTSESELGRNSNIYIRNDIGVYGLVATAEVAILTYGDVEINGDLSASGTLKVGGKTLTTKNASLMSYDNEGNAIWDTITYLTLV